MDNSILLAGIIAVLGRVSAIFGFYIHFTVKTKKILKDKKS
jgi:hypothetical protein